MSYNRMMIDQVSFSIEWDNPMLCYLSHYLSLHLTVVPVACWRVRWPCSWGCRRRSWAAGRWVGSRSEAARCSQPPRAECFPGGSRPSPGSPQSSSSSPRLNQTKSNQTFTFILVEAFSFNGKMPNYYSDLFSSDHTDRFTFYRNY